MAKFSGFGGLSELFNNEKYKAQRAEFENILGQKLYREILYSSFNACYTPKKSSMLCMMDLLVWVCLIMKRLRH